MRPAESAASRTPSASSARPSRMHDSTCSAAWGQAEQLGTWTGRDQHNEAFHKLPRTRGRRQTAPGHCSPRACGRPRHDQREPEGRVLMRGRSPSVLRTGGAAAGAAPCLGQVLHEFLGHAQRQVAEQREVPLAHGCGGNDKSTTYKGGRSAGQVIWGVGRPPGPCERQARRQRQRVGWGAGKWCGVPHGEGAAHQRCGHGSQPECLGGALPPGRPLAPPAPRPGPAGRIMGGSRADHGSWQACRPASLRCTAGSRRRRVDSCNACRTRLPCSAHLRRAAALHRAGLAA